MWLKWYGVLPRDLDEMSGPGFDYSFGNPRKKWKIRVVVFLCLFGVGKEGWIQYDPIFPRFSSSKKKLFDSDFLNQLRRVMHHSSAVGLTLLHKGFGYNWIDVWTRPITNYLLMMRKTTRSFHKYPLF